MRFLKRLTQCETQLNQKATILLELIRREIEKLYSNITVASKISEIFKIVDARFNIYNTSSLVVNIAEVDTLYTLHDGDLAMHSASENFTFDTATGIIKTIKACSGIFVGSADISSSDNSNTTTFELHVNDSLVENGDTPTDFTAIDRIKNISINKLLVLKAGCELKIKVKSTDAMELTVKKINISLKGRLT